MKKCNDCNREFKRLIGLKTHRRGGCSSIRAAGYTRKCPGCPAELHYRNKSTFEYAMLNNCTCHPCAIKNNIGYKQTKETREKISVLRKEKYKTGEWKPNVRHFHTKEARQKMAETKQRNGLSKCQIETLNSVSRTTKISNFRKSFKYSDESRRKMRISAINRVIIKLGKLVPSFNKTACDYFNALMVETKSNIQHALNEGEFYISELGYYVDGYDKINNIVYEWDERRHFNSDGTLKEKDINRQREITEYLKCKFIRIKDPKVLV